MNGKRFFLLFFLCAFVPFAAAKLSLAYGWFDKGATNKGQWQEQEIQIMPALPMGDVHWTIAYITTQKCEKNCIDGVRLLQQLYAGLGRKQLGAQALLITSYRAGQENISADSVAIKTLFIENSLVANLESLEQNFVIINQKGVVLLRYSQPEKTSTEIAADIRADLLRLINYDRSRL